MRTFDYSFLKNQIPGQIVSISSVISDLNAKETLRRKQNPKAFDAPGFAYKETLFEEIVCKLPVLSSIWSFAGRVRFK